MQCNEELDYTNFDVNLRYKNLFSYDFQFSGSTVCTVLFNGTKVYCGNAGDSRAIKVAFTNPSSDHQGGSLTRKSNLNFYETSLEH
jgi:serine/threonine protein phosphatase PrpC